MTWEEFRELFMDKYFLASARHAKVREFLELKQGTRTMLEYVAKFTELASFADDYVAIDIAKVRKFEDGLKLPIQGKILGHLLLDMDSMVKTALAIKREVDDAWSIWDSSVSGKRKGDRPFSFSSRKKQRTSTQQRFRDRATAIKARARMDRRKVGDTS